MKSLNGGIKGAKVKPKRMAHTTGFRDPRIESPARCCWMTLCHALFFIIEKLWLNANSAMESKENHNITSFIGIG